MDGGDRGLQPSDGVSDSTDRPATTIALPADVQSELRTLTAPTVHEDVLTVGTANVDSTGTVLGLRENGRIAYRHDLPREVEWKPASRAGEIYVAGLHGELIGMAADDASTLWRSECADALVGSPSMVDDRLFTIDVRGRLNCVDSRSGTLEWTSDLDEVVQSGFPAIEDGLLVGTATGWLLNVDPDDGSRRWSTSLNQPILARPRVQDGRGYLATYDGTMRVVDVATGESLWDHEVGPIVTPPTVSGSTVCVADRTGRMHAFDVDSGALRWSRSLESPTTAPKATSSGVLYVGDTDGVIRAIDVDSGRVRHTWTVQGSVESLTTTADRVYAVVGSTIVAVDAV